MIESPAPLLPAGSRVAIVAPAHAWKPDRYAAGRAWLEEQGYDTVEVGLGEAYRYYAADDAIRRAGLLDALARTDIDAVWALRGGSGVTRILADLPLADLPSRPLLGFSDVTPLLDVWARLGRPALHAPVVHSLPSTDAESLSHLLDLLQGRPVSPLPGRALVGGSAEAPLVGGNLALVAASVGTPYALPTDGAILVLEDVGEHPYRLERMLAQLRDGGVLDGLAGVALGDFVGCHPPEEAGFTLDEVFLDWLGDLGVPVLADLPIGHGPRNRAWRVRGPGRLADGALILG